jgi:tagatose-6-phosphate ketose/aldose isomerase
MASGQKPEIRVPSREGNAGELELSLLLDRSIEEQEHAGYLHTLAEILHQPETWMVTAATMRELSRELDPLLSGAKAIVLTGSGSSEYAGECVRLPLQKALGVAVQTVGSGSLLTHGSVLLPNEPSSLMISFARSGDSPESVAAVSMALAGKPSVRHLVITCNREGRLVSSFADTDDVSAVVLDDRTNDRSLVMTSSFTNMVLACLSFSRRGEPDDFLALTQKLSDTGRELLLQAFRRLPSFARQNFTRAFYLGSAALVGATRESALKMMEMTSGRVFTACETYLGLRHGPMSAVHPDSLIVCFLSADASVRAYELDLIRELNDKKLGMCKLLVGCDIPTDIVAPNDLVLEHTGLNDDEVTSILYVAVGQVLAFFRCMEEGLRPDAPSEDGVINRVVGEFRIYEEAAAFSGA